VRPNALDKSAAIWIYTGSPNIFTPVSTTKTYELHRINGQQQLPYNEIIPNWMWKPNSKLLQLPVEIEFSRYRRFFSQSLFHLNLNLLLKLVKMDYCWWNWRTNYRMDVGIMEWRTNSRVNVGMTAELRNDGWIVEWVRRRCWVFLVSWFSFSAMKSCDAVIVPSTIFPLRMQPKVRRRFARCICNL